MVQGKMKMNILITCQPGMGHFTPMIPLGKALQARGFNVTVATAKSFENRIREAGFEFLAAGLDFDESNMAGTVPDFLDQPERERARWMLDEIFMNRAPIAMFCELVSKVRNYDIVIHNQYELGGQMAAEKYGIPYVGVNISFVLNREVTKIIQGKQLTSLRRSCGLPDDPKLLSIGKYLDIRLMTPEFNFLNAMTSTRYRKSLAAKLLRGGPRFQVIKMGMASIALGFVKKFVEKQRSTQNERFVNNWSERADQRKAPLWLQSMPRDRKTVYVSLGTVFNSLYPDTFQTILDGLKDLNLNVIVTTGEGVDINRFGPQPTNVYIKKYVPQKYVLPYVDLCINHGGFGSTMGPLSQGIPLISLPLSADQPIVSGIVGACGASVPLPHSIECLDAEGAIGSTPKKLTPEHIRELVSEGLNNPNYKDAAVRMSKKIAELDSLGDAIEDIVSLVGETRNPSWNVIGQTISLPVAA